MKIEGSGIISKRHGSGSTPKFQGSATLVLPGFRIRIDFMRIRIWIQHFSNCGSRSDPGLFCEFNSNYNCFRIRIQQRKLMRIWNRNPGFMPFYKSSSTTCRCRHSIFYFYFGVMPGVPFIFAYIF
jgi:hypothetical protein